MKFVLDRAYHIIFWDHCVGDVDGMKCEFVGWVIGQNKDFLFLSAWQVTNSTDEVRKDNHEKVAILKKAILKKKVLKI